MISWRFLYWSSVSSVFLQFLADGKLTPYLITRPSYQEVKKESGKLIEVKSTKAAKMNASKSIKRSWSTTKLLYQASDQVSVKNEKEKNPWLDYCYSFKLGAWKLPLLSSRIFTFHLPILEPMHHRLYHHHPDSILW